MSLSARRARLFVTIMAILLAAGLRPRPAFADAEMVGTRDFISAISLQDAMLDNDFQLTPRVYHTGHGEHYSLSFTLEKKLADRLCLNLTSALESQVEGGERKTGMENVQMTLFYNFLSLDRYELRSTVGLSGYVPTGDPKVRISNHVLMGPTLMWDEGLGWLANRGLTHYLRPFALEGQVATQVQVGGATSSNLLAGLDLFYSLSYLDLEKKSGLPLASFLNGVSPFVEVAHGQEMAGAGDSNPAFQLFPGFASTWGDESQYQLSLATVVPLSPSAREEADTGVVMLLVIGLNDLIPITRWTPF